LHLGTYETNPLCVYARRLKLDQMVTDIKKDQLKYGCESEIGFKVICEDHIIFIIAVNTTT